MNETITEKKTEKEKKKQKKTNRHCYYLAWRGVWVVYFPVMLGGLLEIVHVSVIWVIRFEIDGIHMKYVSFVIRSDDIKSFMIMMQNISMWTIITNTATATVIITTGYAHTKKKIEICDGNAMYVHVENWSCEISVFGIQKGVFSEKCAIIQSWALPCKENHGVNISSSQVVDVRVIQLISLFQGLNCSHSVCHL